jgi:CRISPR system Cascade subunit CasB
MESSHASPETTVADANLLPKTARPGAFIAYLISLLGENDPTKTDRQALAELRGVLRGTSADYLRAARHVAPYLGEDPHPNDCWFYLVGGLLALHPRHVRATGTDKNGPSLGAAIGRLRGDKSGGMDNRVLALLNTPGDAMAKPLRQIISLLEQGKIGLDYARLLRDLSAWEHSDRWVQKQWARDYFRSGPAATEAPDDDSNDSTTNESEDEQL